MIPGIKEHILLAFSLSLVAAYFGCIGYYHHFDIDITSFLTLQDLSMIFVKWIFFGAIYIFIFNSAIVSFARNTEESKSRWNRTFKNSFVKRRVLIVLPIFIILIILAIFSSLARQTIISAGGGAILGALTLFFAHGIVSIFKIETNFQEFKTGTWILLLFASGFLLAFLPFYAGSVTAKYPTSTQIIVQFQDSTILDSRKGGVVYIGRTHDYFFITNIKDHTVTAYRMDKIKSFSVVN